MTKGQFLLLICGIYVANVLIEAPVLLMGLSRRHRPRTRLFAAVWLNGCTVPIVYLFLPRLIDPETSLYRVGSEAFAIVAECVLFYLAFDHRKLAPSARFDDLTTTGRPHGIMRDMLAIVAANAASILVGLLLGALGLFDWIAP